MQVAYVVVLLVLLIAGCAPVAPETPASEPPIVAVQPATTQPPTKPVAPATQKPATQPAAPVRRQPAPAPAPASAPRSVAPRAPAAPPALDLATLKAQLKDTKAIGVFTKITLKNQVDDLLDRFRAYYEGKAKFSMTELRRSYDLLMMKVLSLLQDDDQKLASLIVSSREAIWGLLADPKKFATLEV